MADRVIPGFTAEQSKALFRVFAASEAKDAELGLRDGTVEIFRATLTARANQFLRVSSPAEGMGLLLPSPKRTVPGDKVTVSLESPAGPLRVSCVPNDDKDAGRTVGLVNGVARATFSQPGKLEFTSNGDSAWTSTTELPAESLAARTLVALGAAGVTGATGAQGIQGQRGFPGEQGDPGQDGDRGFPGQPGVTGATGPTGPAGSGSGVAISVVSQDAAEEPGEFIPRGLGASLRANPRSGGASALMDVGDFINLGLDGPTTGAPQLRSGDSVFRMRGSANVIVTGEASAALNSEGAAGAALVQAFGAGGNVAISAMNATGRASIVTNSIEKLGIDSAGAWALAGVAGAAGQVPTSAGPGADMVWSTPTGGGSSSPEGIVLDPTEVLNFVRTSGTWDLETSFTDSDGTLGSATTAGAVATTALATAGAVLDRVVGECSIYCSSAGTFSVTAAGATVLGPLALVATERVEFTAAQGWRVFGTTGAEKSTPGATGATGASGTPGAPGQIFFSEAPAQEPDEIVPWGWSRSLRANPRSGGARPVIDSSDLVQWDSTLSTKNLQIGSIGLGTDDFSVKLIAAAGTGKLGVDAAREVEIRSTDTGSAVSVFDNGTTAIRLTASGSTPISVQCSGGLVVSTSGTTNGFVTLGESSSGAAISVAAANGMYWVSNDTPCLPRFRDDTNANIQLQNALVVQSAATVVSALTTLLGCTPTYTAAANTLAVGSVFYMKFGAMYVRGATATAHTISCFFNVATFPNVNALVAPTAAGTYLVTVEAMMTVKAIGGGGTCMGWIRATIGNQACTNEDLGSNASASFVLDTTIANAMVGQAQMNTAVAGTTLTAVGGFIQRVN